MPSPPNCISILPLPLTCCVHFSYSAHSRQPSEKSAEHAALSHLDSVISSADKSPALAPGSTWPKYRPQPLSVPADASLRLSAHAPRPPKQHRPSVHSVFAPVQPLPPQPLQPPVSEATVRRRSPRAYHGQSQAHRPRSAYFPQHIESPQRNHRNRPSSGGGQRIAVVGSRHIAYEQGADARLISQRPELRAVSSVPVPPPPPYPHERRQYGYPKSPEVDYDAASVSSLSSSSVSHHSQRPPPPPYAHRHSRNPPVEGKERLVELQKGGSAIGIEIAGAGGHGVFVKRVTEGSIAQRNGITVGDQILEVDGVNLRKAGKEQARNVLQAVQPNESVRILLKYSPMAFQELPAGCASANSTPRATPNHLLASSFPYTSRESSLHSASTAHSREILTSISEADYYAQSPPSPEPRYTTIERHGSQDLGLKLAGGNAMGILVESVEPASLASLGNPTPIFTGDQLLEANGADLRKVTLEQAYFELEKAEGGPVQLLAVYKPAKLERWAGKGQAGDAFYIRVNVDRTAETKDELSLRSGDILFVDKTMMAGAPGVWRAWKLDQAGRQQSCGIIPSKYRLEEECLLRRSGSEISNGDGSSEGGSSRRGTLRRSLKFIRRPSRGKGGSEALERMWLHSRTASKDSRELLDSETTAATSVFAELYQRVERLHYSRKRPVMVLGPLAYPVLSRLAEEMSRVFLAAVPECVTLSREQLDSGIAAGSYVDYRKRDATSLLTHTSSVKTAIEKGFHCLLDVDLEAVQRLQRHQIYPILVCLEWRSPKQLKELSAALGDKVGTKAAKELIEGHSDIHSQMASVNAHLCTVAVPGNASSTEAALRALCEQIESVVEHEQKKTLWVLSQQSLY